MTTLLTLPTEIRDQIWKLIFADRTVSVEKDISSTFHPSECNPCQNRSILPESWNDIVKPLFTCRKIYNEAHIILYNTLTLVFINYQTIDRILEAKSPLLSKYYNLELFLHYNEETRIEWAASILELTRKSPKVKNLTMHHHMRPPMSYEHLVDSLFFAIPLVSMPRGIAANAVLKFDYIFEDIMFASPFLGEIKCSDALEEHELVIRDLLVDDEFNSAASIKDLELMTGALLRIARSHEQPWFAKLQRRRMAELAKLEAQQGNGSGSGSRSES
jgi:hypothetical protein